MSECEPQKGGAGAGDGNEEGKQIPVSGGGGGGDLGGLQGAVVTMQSQIDGAFKVWCSLLLLQCHVWVNLPCFVLGVM